MADHTRSGGTAPLHVELVPSSCWWSNLRSLLPAADWDRLRRQAYAQAGRRCEICGGRGRRWPVEAHEQWSYDDATTTQTLERIVALCPACHQVKHIGRAYSLGRDGPARAHLARVNGWAAADVDAYVAVVFEVWARRSRQLWNLDLTVLAEAGIDLTLDADTRRRAVPE